VRGTRPAPEGDAVAAALADGEQISTAIGTFPRLAEKDEMGTAYAAPAGLLVTDALDAFIQFAVGHLQLFFELAILRFQRLDPSIFGC
jgi:hypothetical protein